MKRWILVSLAVAAVAAVIAWTQTGVHELHVADGSVAASLVLHRPAADDSPWWRGADANGVFCGGPYLITWSSANDARWTVDVPGRGHASPCVSGGQVFVFTADEQSQRHLLLAYDRADGRQLWKTEINQGGLPEQNAKNSHASATPASDGQRVFVSFAAHGRLWTAAVDRGGELIWKTDAGPYHSNHGYGSSPALYGALVIVAGDNKGAHIDRLVGSSFLVALHRETGQIVWRIKREAVDNYATPVVAHVAGKPQLLISGHEIVCSYDPATGDELWRCRWPATNAASTMAFDAERVYVSTTEGQATLMCIRADGQGDVTDSHVVWQAQRGAAYVPSPLVADGLLYVVTDKGVISCFEAATGKQHWKKRLGGDFSASPVLAGGHVYATNESGTTFVIRHGADYELVATNELAGETLATPVFCGGQLLLRSGGRLMCFSHREAETALRGSGPAASSHTTR